MTPRDAAEPQGLAEPAKVEAARPDVEAIRRRTEGATPGPWATTPKPGYNATYCSLVVRGEQHYLVADAARSVDAAFIAHAREDIPALLDEVARLTKERDSYAVAAAAEVRS